jgi:hypothetical protein
VSIGGKQAHIVAASFIGVNGVIESPTLSKILIDPGEDVELGRTYDLEFDRVYPPTGGIGSRLIVNSGNEVADWTATIFGPAVNPTLTVNGIDISFNRNGGLTLQPNESVTISTQNRTVLLNNDPDESRYDRINFTEWSWEQVRLQPGDNTFRYEEDGLNGRVEVSWRSAWL